MLDVNIVIVNYKMKADIERCLASLLPDFADDNLSVNVTVVDNLSGDEIDKFLEAKYPSVKCILNNQNLGFGGATNIGIKSAPAKYYFILNPDTYFFPNQHTVKKLYDFLEAHPKIGLVGPKILYPDSSIQYSCYRFPTFWQPLFSRTNLGQKGSGKIVNDHAMMKDFSHERTELVDWIMGSAMFARGVALDEVNLFDDRFFMYYEDSDLCRRFWEAGWPVYYVHDIVITHVHGRLSAKIPGIFKALLKNKMARVHVISWLKYMWKWRGNYKYYAD
ncbi:MAG: glycosyltransferase family 2 protein [Candidatus Magasanikbacteria bacterium]|nr:glycosyltransferase family 2 protein [Candidatus Magasanikbacteria bacterium]